MPKGCLHHLHIDCTEDEDFVTIVIYSVSLTHHHRPEYLPRQIKKTFRDWNRLVSQIKTMGQLETTSLGDS